MVIEVIDNEIGEVKARTSKLRKIELKLGGKLTTEAKGHWFWIQPIKTRYDGK